MSGVWKAGQCPLASPSNEFLVSRCRSLQHINATECNMAHQTFISLLTGVFTRSSVERKIWIGPQPSKNQSSFCTLCRLTTLGQGKCGKDRLAGDAECVTSGGIDNSYHQNKNAGKYIKLSSSYSRSCKLSSPSVTFRSFRMFKDTIHTFLILPSYLSRNRATKTNLHLVSSRHTELLGETVTLSIQRGIDPYVVSWGPRRRALPAPKQRSCSPTSESVEAKCCRASVLRFACST